MKKPDISVCIPSFNDGYNLPFLIRALLRSKYPSFEIVVVDDGSRDETRNILEEIRSSRLKCIFHRRNLGAARSRNTAAKLARGKILLFFDADVMPVGDAITYVANYFESHPNAQCVTGFPGTVVENKNFFSRYKYYRDLVYWTIEHNNDSFFNFRPAVGAIKSTCFWKAGGFDEKYNGATIEDVEFSYRLANITAVDFDPKWRVRHKFGDLNYLVKTYFQRSSLFMELLSIKRKFTGVAITGGEAVFISVSMLFTMLLILAVFNPNFISTALGVGIYWIYKQRNFARLVLREEGVVFLAGSLITSLLLCHIVIAGAVWYFVRKRV